MKTVRSAAPASRWELSFGRVEALITRACRAAEPWQGKMSLPRVLGSKGFRREFRSFFFHEDCRLVIRNTQQSWIDNPAGVVPAQTHKAFRLMDRYRDGRL